MSTARSAGLQIADAIAAHGSGGGAITQATEATLGGVRGATAGQAIATSGTTILGWSNNRVRQLVSSALPAMTQADIDNATTGRKSVTGALIASNAGGGTELTQAQVEDETDTTFGSVSGERLAQAVAVFAPATTAPDRIVLADAVGVSNTAGPHEITLTEAMVARQIVTFHVVTSGATNPDAVGYLLSDDILDLDAEATAPSDSENGLPFTTTNYTQTSITSQGGNYFVFRKDDSTLWVRPTRLAAHALTITATPIGGGGGTGGQQAGGTTLVETQVITATLGLQEGAFTATWGATPQIGIPLTAIDKDEFDRIEIGIEINSQFVVPLTITRAMLAQLTPTDDIIAPGPVQSTIVQGVYWSGRSAAGSDSREPLVILPTYGWIDARRQANRISFLVVLDDAGGDDYVQAYVGANSNVQIDVEYVTTYHYE